MPGTFSLTIIDDTITPSPWSPVTGDVWSRPTPMGWERLVVLEHKPATTRPALHDIKQDVHEPESVKFIEPFTHKQHETTAGTFRAWIAAYDLRPSGRMRRAPVTEAT